VSDKPKTGDQTKQPAIEGKGIVETEGSLPALASQTQTNYSDKDKNYAGQVLWFIKAPLRWFKWLFQFCDDNAGGVTAVATIMIAVLTAFYVTYSRGQLTVIDGQLKEMQSANRPYIFSVAKFSFSQMPNPETVADFPVTVALINVGVAPALHPIASDPVVGLETDAEISEHMRNCSILYQGGESAPLPPNQPLKDLAKDAAGMTTHTITKHLTEDERKDVIINKTRHLFVLGGIKYSGMRGGEYESTYCYIWNPESMKANVFPWSMCTCNRMK
jgi:hypothetical protein